MVPAICRRLAHMRYIIDWVIVQPVAEVYFFQAQALAAVTGLRSGPSLAARSFISFGTRQQKTTSASGGPVKLIEDQAEKTPLLF